MCLMRQDKARPSSIGMASSRSQASDATTSKSPAISESGKRGTGPEAVASRRGPRRSSTS
eukprot:5648674-Lingulodinium_polyedra.AAC.1